MVDAAQRLAHFRIAIFAHDHADDALSGRWQHVFHRDRRCQMRHAEPRQAGHGEICRIREAILQLAHARCHIPPERHDLHVRPQRQRLGLPPQRGRTDLGAFRQVCQSFGMRRQETLTRIFALREGSEYLARRQNSRHILETVHGDIDIAPVQRGIEFAREKPLAAGIYQAFRCQLIARCCERHDLTTQSAARGDLKRSCDLPCLHQRER